MAILQLIVISNLFFFEKARDQNIMVSLNKSMMNLYLYYAVLHVPLTKKKKKEKETERGKRKDTKATKSVTGPLYHTRLNSTPQTMTNE